MKELMNAKRDHLTNCFVKEELKPFLNKLLFESGAYKKPLAILVIDVDKFKSFNDKYGHLCGDEVLKYFSSTLRLSLEDVENAPFRFGGDEFVIVFPGKNSKEAYPFAIKIMKNMKSRHFLLKGRQLRLSFSGGIASFPTDAKTLDELFEKADKAMYASKKRGHGKTTQFSKIWQSQIIQFAGIVGIFVIIFAVSVVIMFRQTFISNLRYAKVNFKQLISTSFWKKFDPRNILSGKRGQELRRKTSIPIFRVPEEKLDTIYLKTGGILRGVIVREDFDEVELKVMLDEGEGTVVIKDFEVDRIERAE